VDVEYGLARGGARVYDHPVPVLRDPLLSSQFLGHEEQLPHELGVGTLEFGDRCDVISGDDEDVGGSLRVDVPESKDLRV